MTEDELKRRTKRFAIRVFNLVDALPCTAPGRTVASQLAQSGSSVVAIYRSACRARSKAEFVAKLGVAREEADESCYWLELVIEAEMLPLPKVDELLGEADELTAILTASLNTTRRARE